MPISAKPTYTVQGKVFVLKPTSRRNREAVQRFLELEHNQLRERADALKNNARRSDLIFLQENDKYNPEEHGKIPEEIKIEEEDDYRFYFEFFRVLTDGPHDDLDFDDFDIKITEQVRDDFLPERYKMATLLATSFLQ